MGQLYFVLYTNEDGDVRLEALDRKTLLNRLKENYWGEAPSIRVLEEGQIVDVREKNGLYIIAGEAIIPRPKKVVEEWDV